MTHAIEKLPKLTRRALLQVASGAAGAVSILGLSPRIAKAAKVSKAAVAYQDSPKGDQNCVLIPSEIAHHSDFKSPVIPK